MKDYKITLPCCIFTDINDRIIIKCCEFVTAYNMRKAKISCNNETNDVLKCDELGYRVVINDELYDLVIE